MHGFILNSDPLSSEAKKFLKREMESQAALNYHQGCRGKQPIWYDWIQHCLFIRWEPPLVCSQMAHFLRFS